MPNDLPTINELTQKHVAWLLTRFCELPGDRNCGGFVDVDTGYADSRNSIYNAQNLFAAYLYPDFPEFYGNPALLRKLRQHLEFMQRRQYPDGTVGLIATGVGSGNEVGFTLPGVCETYRRLRASDLPGREELMTGLEEYLQRGAEAVRHFFPHTSNHRWTACAGPLAVVESLFPDPGNGAVIEEYLSDGIDIDADGLFYEERSPNYNNVAQLGLLYLVDYWQRPDLLALVSRNLRYCLEMRQPSGEAETLFSHRQDRGNVGANWGAYYPFKRLAVEMGDGVFARAADCLLNKMRHVGRMSETLMPLRYCFDDARFVQEEIVREPLPEHFEVRFRETPLWRFRDRDVAATVAADAGGHFFDITQGTWGGKMRSDCFLSYHVGAAVLDAMKIRWGSGTGGFRPERIEYEPDGTLQLSAVDPGWSHVAHYRPQGKWGPRQIEADQNAQVTIRRGPDGVLHLRIQIGGWADMPVNIQMLLRETCLLTSPDGRALPLKRGGRTFTAGDGVYALTGPDGARLLLTGLPTSAHQLLLEDQRRIIPGEAESRCHGLVAGLFTPVDFTLMLSPVRQETNRAGRDLC